MAILHNEFGSMRYHQFIRGLGSLIWLKDVDKTTTYLGGLDHADGDGDFAFIWEDDLMQAIDFKSDIYAYEERSVHCCDLFR